MNVTNNGPMIIQTLAAFMVGSTYVYKKDKAKKSKPGKEDDK
jgi:hypothetical protein